MEQIGGIYVSGNSIPAISGNTISNNTYGIFQGVSDPIYSGNVYNGVTNRVIGVGGTLNQDLIWEDVQGLGIPYLVFSTVTINSGRTLTIPAGMVVKFQALDSAYSSDVYRYDLVVNGTLALQGTASQPVIFTSSRDDSYGGDSNGDGTSSSPAATNWGYIQYANPANVLHDAVIRYGGLGLQYNSQYYTGGVVNTQMVWVTGSTLGTLEIRNCVIEKAYDKAIYVDSTQAPNIHDNTIRNNPYGVYLAGTGVLTIQNNTYTSDSWGVYLNSPSGTPTVSGNTFSGNTYPIYQGTTDPVYSGNIFSGNTNTAIAVGGSLGADVVLESAGLPYLVYSDFTSPSGKTLTVDGGVIVKFASGKKLTVQGPFITNDNGSPVVFTSYRDDSYGGDTNGDGSSSGSPGDWAGIYFQTTNNIIDHALIRYAGINISGPAITLRQVTFDHTPDPAITLASGGVGTNIHSSNFLNASGYAIRNNTTNTIDARSNYWGSPSGPGGVGPGTGAGVTTYVTYSPWLTSPASINSTGPVITSSANTSAVVLNPYRYDADSRASATGVGTLVWSRILGPTDFAINSSTGEVAWSAVTPGDYVVGIAVTDDVGSTDQIWQIHVAMTGDTTPPTIVSYSYQITNQGGGLAQATMVSTFSEGVQVRPIDVALLNASGQTVPINSLSYDVVNHQLTVVASNLAANATYTYRLLDTITDDALNPLDGEFNGYTLPTGNGISGGNFSVNFLTDIVPPLVTIDLLSTNSHSPALHGTIDDPTATIQVAVAGNSYTAANNGNGTWTLPAGTIAPSLQPGVYDVSVTATDLAGNVGTDTTTGELRILSAVVGRHIFCNNSTWDADPANPNGDPAANSFDNNAIAPENSSDPHLSKTALLPGQTASFNNYTSFSLGINGIMVDFDHLPGTVTAADFEFKMGNTTTPDTWGPAPAPLSVTVRQVNGIDRVTIIWADGTIQNTWLQVTVKATAATGLAQNDVFYYGNAVGESGDSATNTLVNSADDVGARLNPRTPFNPAAIDNPYDYNRDRLVNSADQVIPRYNATTPWTMLKFITAPAVVTMDDAAATDKATAVPIAVLSNDSNVGGALSVSRADAASSLGASLLINADQTIRYDPSVSTTLQALMAGQSLWDTFTYTIQDNKGLADTATVNVLVSGVNEAPQAPALVLSAVGSESAAAASSPTVIIRPTAAAAAHDAALSSANLAAALGYLRWLDEFDLLGNGSRKSEKDNSVFDAVDAVMGGGKRSWAM